MDLITDQWVWDQGQALDNNTSNAWRNEDPSLQETLVFIENLDEMRPYPHSIQRFFMPKGVITDSSSPAEEIKGTAETITIAKDKAEMADGIEQISEKS